MPEFKRRLDLWSFILDCIDEISFIFGLVWSAIWFSVFYRLEKKYNPAINFSVLFKAPILSAIALALVVFLYFYTNPVSEPKSLGDVASRLGCGGITLFCLIANSLGLVGNGAFLASLYSFYKQTGLESYVSDEKKKVVMWICLILGAIVVLITIFTINEIISADCQLTETNELQFDDQGF